MSNSITSQTYAILLDFVDKRSEPVVSKVKSSQCWLNHSWHSSVTQLLNSSQYESHLGPIKSKDKCLVSLTLNINY